jgi:hypothetical protein
MPKVTEWAINRWRRIREADQVRELDRCERLGIEPRQVGGTERGAALAIVFALAVVCIIAECVK